MNTCTREGMVFEWQKCIREGLFCIELVLLRYILSTFRRYAPIPCKFLTLLTSTLSTFASNTKKYMDIFGVVLETV